MKYTLLFVRLAIGLAFLSAVADRWGGWGPPGSAHAVWGNWANFEAYTHQLLFYVGDQVNGVMAATATLLELVLGVLLILGYKTKLVACLSGVLLLGFAASMTLALGIKSTFDYGVWTAAGASFLLSMVITKTGGMNKYSLDAIIAKS